jgi:hypothetical protein
VANHMFSATLCEGETEYREYAVISRHTHLLLLHYNFTASSDESLVMVNER